MNSDRRKVEGDRQAPEGFYSITPGLMNPNSNYYLAINIGFPNAYDKANGYSGAFLMIHGDCSSRGCYAMTDEQIGEIYSLAREAFLGGEKSFQIQAYPFRLTPANLARHRTNPNMAFWKMLKEGNDHFLVTHLEPKVDVCERHYVFDAQPPAGSTKPLVFTPSGRCPAYEVPQEIAGPALEKEKNDDYQLAQMIKENVPVAPIVMGTDGGMNSFFVGKLEVTQPVQDNEGRLHAPPIHPGMPPPTLSGPREDPQAGTAVSLRRERVARSVRQTVRLQAERAAGSSRIHCDEQRGPFELLRQSVQAEDGCGAGARPAGRGPCRLKPDAAPPQTETAKAEAPTPEQQRPEQQKPEPQQASAPQAASQAAKHRSLNRQLQQAPPPLHSRRTTAV